MDYRYPTCDICYQNYDNSIHIPHILKECGHTFCSDCILKQLSSQHSHIMCPTCRKKTNGKSLSDFPKNFEFLKTLESIHKFLDIRCKIHCKKFKKYCNIDQILLCSHCIPDHNDHEIISIEEFKEKVDLRIKESEFLIHYHENDRKFKLEREKSVSREQITQMIESLIEGIRVIGFSAINDFEMYFDSLLQGKEIVDVEWKKEFSSKVKEWSQSRNLEVGREILNLEKIKLYPLRGEEYYPIQSILEWKDKAYKKLKANIIDFIRTMSHNIAVKEEENPLWRKIK